MFSIDKTTLKSINKTCKSLIYFQQLDGKSSNRSKCFNLFIKLRNLASIYIDSGYNDIRTHLSEFAISILIFFQLYWAHCSINSILILFHYTFCLSCVVFTHTCTADCLLACQANLNELNTKINSKKVLCLR